MKYLNDSLAVLVLFGLNYAHAGQVGEYWNAAEPVVWDYAPMECTYSCINWAR